MDEKTLKTYHDFLMKVVPKMVETQKDIRGENIPPYIYVKNYTLVKNPLPFANATNGYFIFHILKAYAEWAQKGVGEISQLTNFDYDILRKYFLSQSSNFTPNDLLTQPSTVIDMIRATVNAKSNRGDASVRIQFFRDQLNSASASVEQKVRTFRSQRGIISLPPATPYPKK